MRFVKASEVAAPVIPETEREIIGRLREMLAHTTTLLISHRLSALQHADDIVVLGDGGRVVERGTHAELIKRGGVYASLYERQLLDADIAALGSAAHDDDEDNADDAGVAP